jgi:putative hydrolase of the HAD superfamily
LKFIDYRYEGYRKWAFENMAESDELTLWTKWLTPEYDRERITANAYALSYQYRQCTGFRTVVPGGHEVIHTLKKRGYVLGIISNLITTWEVPDWLRDEGLTDSFATVELSAVCGLRKPDPAIYLLGAKNAGVAPEHCAYVGDNFNRDVTGSKAAGFGANIIFTTQKKFDKAMETVTDDNRPDGVVFDFLDLLKVFPEAGKIDLSVTKPAQA